MSLNRRSFLRNTAAAGAAGAAFFPSTSNAVTRLSPDERIDAAIEQIKAAYLEKWPGSATYIRDFDNIDEGMIIIFSHDPSHKGGGWDRTVRARECGQRQVSDRAKKGVAE